MSTSGIMIISYYDFELRMFLSFFYGETWSLLKIYFFVAIEKGAAILSKKYMGGCQRASYLFYSSQRYGKNRDVLVLFVIYLFFIAMVFLLY